MTPAKLIAEVTRIVAEECHCAASYAQHPGEIASAEAYRIRSKVSALLRTEHVEAVDREIEARRRIDRGILPSIGR